MTATEGIAQVNTLATHTALSAWSWANDFLIIIILFGIFFAYAYYFGRAALVATLISMYAGYALYIVLPLAGLLPVSPALTALGAHIALYAALSLAFYIILRRIVVSDFLYIGIFGLIILSFLGAGLLLALAYHIFSVTSFYQFTPAIDLLFSPNQNFYWWFAAPVIGLFFLAR